MTLIMTPVKSFEFELLETYCLGKSKLWNMFFGWRKTIDKGINGEWAYYKLNHKDYEAIQLKAETMEEKNNFQSGITALFIFKLFGGARTYDARRIYHYTTPTAFCQVEIRVKNAQI